MSAVEVRGLKKTFRLRRNKKELLMPWRPRRTTEALVGVDLKVERGELVALIGPNGAGKTTLLDVLATLVLPTSGTAYVEGYDVAHDAVEVRRRIGYVLTEERSFFWRLTVRDNLMFFAALQGLFGATARERIESVAESIGLVDQLAREFSALSAGQKQRVAIARGLLPDPPVLLFDEATRSLDPGRAERVRRVVRRLVDRDGKAVVFATHDLDEARDLSDRIVCMAKGSIACAGRFEDVEAEAMALFVEEAQSEDAELHALLSS
ncbi:MAG: ABC transporter ATP-binding protein [Deltaproteobacteria bacterium]